MTEIGKGVSSLAHALDVWHDVTLLHEFRAQMVTKGANVLKHGAILYNEAEVFSPSITNPNGRPMLPFDWLIHSGLILARCHKILFFCFLGWEVNLETKIRRKKCHKVTAKVIYYIYGNIVILQPDSVRWNISCCCTLAAKIQSEFYERSQLFHGIQDSALSLPSPF